MKIEIADSDFPRLKALAEPFVDTPATVITKLLDQFESIGVPAKGVENQSGPTRYSLESLPPLTHTKIMSGNFNNKRPDKINWDGFVRQALMNVFDKLKSTDGVRRASGAQIRDGKFEDHGFKYIQSVGFSYQGVSAGDAIQIIGRCAREIGQPFEIEFVWRDNADAFQPGKRGIIGYP